MFEDPVFRISKAFEVYHHYSTFLSNNARNIKKDIRRRKDQIRKSINPEKNNGLLKKLNDRLNKLNSSLKKEFYRKGPSSVGPEEILLFEIIRILFQGKTGVPVPSHMINWTVVTELFRFASENIFNIRKNDIVVTSETDEVKKNKPGKAGRKLKSSMGTGNPKTSFFNNYFNASRLSNNHSDKTLPIAVSYRFAKKRLVRLSHNGKDCWSLPFKTIIERA